MKRTLLLLAFLGACSRSQPDQERLGDRASHDGRWGAAVTAYRAAGDAPRVDAKLADAAFQAGSLLVAVHAWNQLAAAAPTRVGEAANGLARTAAAAERTGDQAALAEAIGGLARVAPGWPLGRLSLRLAHGSGADGGSPPDLAILPAALAAGPGRGAVDTLLYLLGVADGHAGDCDRAVAALESVLRRSGDIGLRDSATSRLAGCELTLGLAALHGEKAADAEGWFERASRHDPAGPVGRRALVGLGDARLTQGDSLAAVAAWQAVVEAVAPPDSITQMALERLHGPPTGVTTDSIRPETW